MSFYTSVVSYGNTLLVREINEEGVAHSFKTKFKPTLYIQSTDPSAKYAGIHGEKLEPKKFDTIREARDFTDTFKGVEGFNIYGMNKYDIQFLAEKYKNIKYDTTKIKNALLDIEVYSPDEFPKPEEAKHPVNAITWYDTSTGTYRTYGLNKLPTKLWHAKSSVISFAKEVKYQMFTTEEDLLIAFLTDWSSDCPHVVSGWNSEGFDIPYLINRITALLGEDWAKKLSPWKMLKTRDGKDRFGNPVTKHNIVGVAQLDYMELYQKHTFENQEFYTLDHIAYVELGEKKLDYSDVKGLHELWEKDYQKFIDYNIKDVELIVRLEEKLNLFGIVYDISYFSLINYEDTFSPVKTWDAIINTHLAKSNIIIPYETHGNKAESFAGAYVKTPKPGLYNWIVSFDLASLYPSIIRQWNIGPETLVNTSNYGDHVEKLLTESVKLDGKTSYAANGVEFTTETQSFMSELMEWLYNERKDAKDKSFKAGKADDKKNKDLFNTRQMVLKILLNSAYGALGNQYFRFFDIKLATAITLSGQLAIKWIAKDLNAYFNKILLTNGVEYVIYIDTDSVYLNMENFVGKIMGSENNPHKITEFLDKAMKQVEKTVITPSYQRLKDYLSCREQLMIMDREVIGSTAIWTAKKRYAINMYDKEGERYQEPKLKIMGLETVKKDYPEICRKALKESIRIILQENDNDHLIKYVSEFSDTYHKTDYRDIAQTKSVNYVSKYYSAKNIYARDKTVPYNSKAALLFNHFSDEEDIKNGAKIKIVFLIMPNTIAYPIMGFVHSMPEGYELQKYVDYDLMFEKHFLKPLKSLTSVIGWETEETSSLSDFF